jgi:hypothetical protein
LEERFLGASAVRVTLVESEGRLCFSPIAQEV